ncbi:MAG: hypothetical protein U0165_01910 [Polyangiaceae bacterium]
MAAPPRSRIEVRDAVGELLRDTRGLRREQQQERDAWFSRLSLERKDELLFELEILLKGVACFANPRNHPGPPRRAPVVVQDFRDPLALVRDTFSRVAQLSRILLGERDRVFVFQRYLETVLPEDTARTRLVRAGMTQTTPEEALFVLRHGMTNLIEVTDGILRLPRVPFRLFYALAGTAQREIGNNAYFNPLSALEFRPEFDRITSRQVLELIANVPGEQAHRLVALTFLSLFRMLRYLRLTDSIAREHGDGRRLTGRIFLVLAVLRSDARALAIYLRQHAGTLLAESFEQTIFKTPVSAIHEQHDSLRAQGHRLISIRSALEGVAATLRLEMRRTFEHDLPPPDAGAPPEELKTRTIVAVSNLRPALQNAIMFLARSLGVKLDEGGVFDEKEARRISSERLRRDIWIFAQILRAFTLKARHADASEDRWAGAASFQFVREFLSYFRSMGYPLLRVSDYPRFDAFMMAMSALEDTDLVNPERLERAITEAEAFQEFLQELFISISRREELTDIPFDKKAAATALKLYLGRS